jgi:outer membrane receptor for ferrienterochelin and colicin
VPGLLKLFCCGVLLWVSFSPALADTGDSDELLDEFAFLQEEEIVLTAAKHKQRVGFSPSAVIVITRKDIDESGATTLTELLRRYPATHVYMYDPFIIQTQVRGTTRVLFSPSRSSRLFRSDFSTSSASRSSWVPTPPCTGPTRFRR